jgi:hypothetical protein
MNPVVALALAGQDKTALANATGSPPPLSNRSTQRRNASKVDEPSLSSVPALTFVSFCGGFVYERQRQGTLAESRF